MRVSFKLWLDDLMVAYVEAPSVEEAYPEVMRYVRGYSMDGRVSITSPGDDQKQHMDRLFELMSNGQAQG